MIKSNYFHMYKISMTLFPLVKLEATSDDRKKMLT